MTTTHTVIARCAIHPDLFDLDPHHQFDQLTDDQLVALRDHLEASYETEGDLRRSVGIVFEDTFLFSDSIAANIAFADPDASFEQIRTAAELSGAAAFIDDLPLGYDTEIGERGFTLSGGQRQRIAIARAILADPRVLILDDATSAVDPAKEHEIRDALGEVMRDRTTIVIAHRPATIALAERVILIGDGRVLADGTHADLLSRDVRYQEVLASAEAHAEQQRHADRDRAGTGEVVS